jgi:hypothetical protein
MLFIQLFSRQLTRIKVKFNLKITYINSIRSLFRFRQQISFSSQQIDKLIPGPWIIMMTLNTIIFILSIDLAIKLCYFQRNHSIFNQLLISRQNILFCVKGGFFLKHLIKMIKQIMRNIISQTTNI